MCIRDSFKACPHWRQKSPKTETKSIRSSSPKTATKVCYRTFQGTTADTADKDEAEWDSEKVRCATDRWTKHHRRNSFLLLIELLGFACIAIDSKGKEEWGLGVLVYLNNRSSKPRYLWRCTTLVHATDDDEPRNAVSDFNIICNTVCFGETFAKIIFLNDTATTEIYTILFVGSVRCV